MRYDATPTTSIQNRFDVRDITTTAVFHVDDDVRIPCATLARAHAAWKSNRTPASGFYPRAHRWDAKKCKHEYVWGDVSLRLGGAFSVVLTKAAFTRTEYLRLYADHHLPEEARRYVDERKNCEDIAMQLVASAVTGAAPVYVPVPALRYWWDKLAGFGVAGISKGGGHHDVRGACVTDLSRMIMGRGVGPDGENTPLVDAPLRPWSERSRHRDDERRTRARQARARSSVEARGRVDRLERMDEGCAYTTLFFSIVVGRATARGRELPAESLGEGGAERLEERLDGDASVSSRVELPNDGDDLLRDEGDVAVPERALQLRPVHPPAPSTSASRNARRTSSSFPGPAPGTSP